MQTPLIVGPSGTEPSSYAGLNSSMPVVRAQSATYSTDTIEATYPYASVHVDDDDQAELSARVVTRTLQFRTARRVPKTGLLMVGLSGNNGSTVVAGILANRMGLSWRTKDGVKEANWMGSLMLSSTARLGLNSKTSEPVFVPFSALLPLLRPEELFVSGWDINGLALGDGMRKACVIDVTLQDQLYEQMQQIRPLPGIYLPDFVAENQRERATNVLSGSLWEQMEQVRGDIREFRQRNELEKVIVLWTGTTERMAEIQAGLNDTAKALLESIRAGSPQIAPSTLYAVAAILEGCSFINGSPQNTCVPGVVDLAKEHGVFLAGDDLKSGQTKLKSVLVDFLVSAGLKPTAIVSYNHLGNNDGRNLSAPSQFRSKEISKSTVVDDMVRSNRILYKPNESPDHCVVIKYIPSVGDSKRALDEYTSEIFLGGKNTIVVHNTCEDSLLATPIILDLVLLSELCQRISVRVDNGDRDAPFETFHPVLSILSYLCKAPLVPPGCPVVNALFPQRMAILNVLRACLGLPPDSFMDLEHRFPSLMFAGGAPEAANHVF